MIFRSLAAAALACAAQWAGAQTPAVNGVSITSTPASGDTYELAEIIEMRVTFDQAVDVTGAPRLSPTVGSATRVASYYQAGSSATSLAFRYAVQSSHTDTDGISIGANALTLNGGTIRIQGGATNAALSLGTHAIANAANHKVDGSIETAPTVESVSITSSPSSGDTYELGETIEVSVTFDRGIQDVLVTAPRLALTIGSATRTAHLHYTVEDSRDADAGYRTLIRFRYAVQSSDTDADGISVGASALATDWSPIKVKGGTTNAVLDLGTHAISSAANHKVDGSQESTPTVTGVSIDRLGLFGDTYHLAGIIFVEVMFDRSVSVTGATNEQSLDRSGGGPQLALTIGSATRQAHYVSIRGSVRNALAFSYVVQSSDMDADGLSIGASALTLNGGTIRIRGGTANAVLGLGTHALANSANHKVDGSIEPRPAALSAAIVSDPTSGDTYAPGETIRVWVSFNKLLDVTGAPQLALTIGSVTRQASYDGIYHQALEFVYTVQMSDFDADGISIGAGALTLNGGTIKIRGGTTDASLDIGYIGAVTNAAGHKVDGSGRSVREVGDVRNESPRLADELAHLEIDVGKTQTVDLAPAFEDPDGDPLRYSASSSSDVVSVQVVHGTASVRGLSPGEATITITAADPEGLSATTTFKVVVGAILSLSGVAAAPEGGTAVLEATLSRALAAPLDISWRVVADGDSSTPDADASDSERTGETTIPAGKTTGTIEVAIANDDDIEPAREYFVVALDEPQTPNVALSDSARATAAIQEGVCDRTPVVRDELASNWRGCHWPKPIDLAQISTLDLRKRAIDALRPSDLLGLAGLERLDLSGNALSDLPDGLFAGLGRLRQVSVEDNPGAPFALAVQLTRTDADPWAPGPADILAEAEFGAPFALTAPLRATPASAEHGAPATVRVAAGETTGTTFRVRPTAGAALVLRTDAAPVPTTRCGALPCFRGFAPMAGPALTLFHRPPQALTAPTPQPLEGGTALRLPLDSLIAPGDAADDVRWETSSSNKSLARVRIVGADLLVDPGWPASEGTVEVTLTATDPFGLVATMRFEVRVAFHWPPDFGRGWRATLQGAADNDETRAR